MGRIALLLSLKETGNASQHTHNGDAESNNPPFYSTTTVTVTVDPDEPAKFKRDGSLNYRAATVKPTAVPAYASGCDSAARYSSACSCWGITATTSTAPQPTSTVTVTVTADYCEDL